MKTLKALGKVKEVRHQKPRVAWVRLLEMSGRGRSIETDGGGVLTRKGGWEDGRDCWWAWSFLVEEGDENVQQRGDECTTWWIYKKKTPLFYTRCVNCIACEV